MQLIIAAAVPAAEYPDQQGVASKHSAAIERYVQAHSIPSNNVQDHIKYLRKTGLSFLNWVAEDPVRQYMFA